MRFQDRYPGIRVGYRHQSRIVGYRYPGIGDGYRYPGRSWIQISRFRSCIQIFRKGLHTDIQVGVRYRYQGIGAGYRSPGRSWIQISKKGFNTDIQV